jgi:GT2 family glycosyltransferase
MAHTMSSLFTTGGIRGGTKMIGKYQPRSFNMGISRETFLRTGGFHFDRFAEDIDLSIRMQKLGLQVWLIPEAYVFHKRRANLAQFFRQVYNFGKGRAMVGHFHSGEVKWVHWFPAFFSGGILLTFGIYFFNASMGIALSACYVVYLVLVAIDAVIKSKSISMAFLSIPAVFTQMIGYGAGFLSQKVKYLQGNK